MELIREISNPSLLNNGFLPPGTYDFLGFDNEDRWQQNRKEHGPEWEYYDKKLRYTINTQNYRAPEWDRINWRKSIVIYGCSMVFGDGLDDSETISAQLQKITGRSVINLGAGGTGPQWQLANQTLMLTHFCEPWATVTFWPSYHRTLFYFESIGAQKLGPWNVEKGGYFDLYNRGRNAASQFWFIRQQSRLLHRNAWIEGTFDPDLAADTGITQMQCEGSARDLVHPSAQSARWAAEWIAEQLPKK